MRDPDDILHFYRAKHARAYISRIAIVCPCVTVCNVGWIT